MGLLVLRVGFDDAAPSEETFRAALASEIGDLYGLETFGLDGNVVEVATMMDPVTFPYALKVLLRLGGTPVAAAREKAQPQLPAYTSQRWVDLPWWKRTWIRTLFLLGLAWSAIPAPPGV